MREWIPRFPHLISKLAPKIEYHLGPAELRLKSRAAGVKSESLMRVAAIYDIHGNLPALEAVLREIRQAKVDQVVVGGDVLPGPMPRETLACLADLDIPVHCIYGNGEVAVWGAGRGLAAARPRY